MSEVHALRHKWEASVSPGNGIQDGDLHSVNASLHLKFLHLNKGSDMTEVFNALQGVENNDFSILSIMYPDKSS